MDLCNCNLGAYSKHIIFWVLCTEGFPFLPNQLSEFLFVLRNPVTFNNTKTSESVDLLSLFLDDNKCEQKCSQEIWQPILLIFEYVMNLQCQSHDPVAYKKKNLGPPKWISKRRAMEKWKVLKNFWIIDALEWLK